jgi:hypothetical protein
MIFRVMTVGKTVADAVEGPTAGDSLVEIYGGAFRLAPAPAPGPTGEIVNGSVVWEEPTPTVRVLFGTTEAPRVDVIRSNLLRVTTPKHEEGLTSVTVLNLDDNGDPIVGESVTLSGAYRFRRPRLDAENESNLLRVIRTMIQALKRDVLKNVVFTVDVDFDPDPSTPSIEIATTPAIALVLSELPENRQHSLNEHQEIRTGSDVQIARKPRTVDLVFQLIGISDNVMELVNLLSATTEFIERNHTFDVVKDPAVPEGETVAYDLDFLAPFKIVATNTASGMRYFTGTVALRGFDHDGFEGFGSDHVRALSTELVESVELEVTRFDS